MSGHEVRWEDRSSLLRSSPDDLLERAADFEPLDFEAGRAAAAWLRQAAQDGVAVDGTRLAVDERSGALLGFVATRRTTFTLTKSRRVALQLRRFQLRSGDQPAIAIDWVARSARTPPGFGRQLLLATIAGALADGAGALIVEPSDEGTREMWRRQYRFVPFEARQHEGYSHPEWLWFPLGDPGGNWPS